MARSATGGSGSNHMLTFFFFLTKLPNCFPEWQYFFQFHQQCMSDLESLYSCKHLVLSLFFYFSHSKIGVVSRILLLLVLIVLFLRANDVDHLFMCLSTICRSSLVKSLLISLLLFSHSFVSDSFETP